MLVPGATLVKVHILGQRAREGYSPVYTQWWRRTVSFCRVTHFGSGALRDGNSHLKLNTNRKPIVNKYREGKVKSTLKRELKVSEVT